MRGEPAYGTADGIATRGPVAPSDATLEQGVVTGPAVEDVLPRPTDQRVVAGAAAERVVAGAGDQDVVAVAAVRRELDGVGRQARGVHRVVAGQGVDREQVPGGLGAGDVDLGGQAEDGNPGRVAGDHHRVVAIGAVDDDGVGLAVAGAAAGGRRQVDVDRGHVRAGQVVDGDGVRPAQGVEVNLLHAVEVHRDGGHVAEEDGVVASGGDGNVLVDVGAVEEHRVVAVPALDGVAAVAGVPHEGVVAWPHQRHVVATTAVDHVVAVAAEDEVVAVAAVDRELDRVGPQRPGVDDVVPAQAVERQLVQGRVLEEDVHVGVKPEDVEPADVARDPERIGALGAVDGDGVSFAVGAAVGAAQVQADLRHVGPGEVVDDDVVRPTQRPELDVLDPVEVHRDVAGVAEEADAGAVGGDVDAVADVGAEEQHLIVAALPLDGVAAVTRVPLEDVVAGTHAGDVVALVAVDEVVAVAAQQQVGTLAAEDPVVARAAVQGQLDDTGRQCGGRQAVVAVQRLDAERVVGPLGVGDVHRGRQPDHGGRGPLAEDVDGVVAVGAVDDDGVGLAVAAAARGAQVQVDLGQGGAGQVVDGDGVAPAQGVDVEPLHVVEVHRHAGNVPGEVDLRAVGRDDDVLVDVGAVEDQRVVAALAVDPVAAVAGVPDERVVPGTADHHVVAAAAVDEVVAVAAEQPVGALAADDGVVARPAVYRQVDQVGAQSGGVHAVIAAVGVEDQVLGGADVQEERGRVDAVEANAGAVGGDGEGLGDVAAVDLDGVVAGAALVEGAAVAGVPDHAVVARLAEDLVVAPAAGQDVVAGAAEQQVVAALAEQDVVARLTEELVVA